MAEAWARAHGGRVAYVATGLIRGDPEWDARVAAHRARRPASWLTLETGDPVAALRACRDAFDLALIDCLTLLLFGWCGGHGGEPPPAEELERRGRDLVAGLRALGCDAILVSNEVGLGIVPATPGGRRFRDALGVLNQAVAAAADAAYLVVAGQPVLLKPRPAGEVAPPWSPRPV